MGTALFDRLAAVPGDPFPASGPIDVAESIRMELERLLNTRRTVRKHTAPASVIDYGINDWSALYGDREEDRRALMRDVRLSVEHFEPRLRITALDAQAIPGQRRSLLLRIAGQLRHGTDVQPLEFVMTLGESSFEVLNE